MRGEALAAGLLLAVTTFAPANGATCWDTAWRCRDVNAYRADNGAGPLDQRAALQDSAKAWARELASSGVLRHSTDGLTEIVGRSTDWPSVMVAWDESTCHDPLDPKPCPQHREILRDPTLEQVGIGVAHDDSGTAWFVVQFG